MKHSFLHEELTQTKTTDSLIIKDFPCITVTNYHMVVFALLSKTLPYNQFDKFHSTGRLPLNYLQYTYYEPTYFLCEDVNIRLVRQRHLKHLRNMHLLTVEQLEPRFASHL